MSTIAAPEVDPLARPSWACVLCAPPRNVGAWRQADSGYCTCSSCDTALRDRLDDVARRFLQLDPRPGGAGGYGSRGAPGFRSRPPCSLHVVALRDPRSSADAKIWVGGDGRVHGESERPPLSVFGVLNCQSWAIAEHRGVDGPGDHEDVFGLLRWLNRHISYAARHAELVTELDRAVRDLIGQLKPLTGDGRRRIGLCPAEIVAAIALCRCGHEAAVHDNDALVGERRCNHPLCECRAYIPINAGPADEPERQVCDAALFAPTNGDDSIRCGYCGAHWAREDWLQLGDLLMQAA